MNSNSKNMSLNFCFIGAGNLATQLSKSLKENGFNIVQVFSKTENSAKFLAQKVHSDHTTVPKEITTEADVYFITLKDSVFDEVLSKINFNNQIVVHCSGSQPISVLEKYASAFGVFYPLQTFSKQRDVDFREIPVFVEANSKETENLLLNIAGKISDSVSVLSSEKRKYLHIAAVFACNFVNHLYTVAAKILEKQEIQFEVLRPLIMETAMKVQEMEPESAQTGPAVRFDENIIFAHLREIENFKHYPELYNSISKSIFEHHQKLK